MMPPHMFKLCQLYACIPIDRFVAVEPPKGFCVHDNIRYRPKKSTAKYADLMDARARHFVDMDKPILVYWSGGIDSTAVLVALLRAGANPMVAMTHHSIAENPAFYKNHIRNRLATVEAMPVAHALLSGEGIVTTGQLCDQLFGGDIEPLVCERVGCGMWHDSLSRQQIVVILEKLNFSQSEAEALYGDVLSSAAAAGVTLRTIHDWCWWMNFAFKWSYVKNVMLLYSPLDAAQQLTEEHLARRIHFVDTQAFQDWSVARREAKIIDRLETYKITAKRYIYEYDGDDEYLRSAVVRGSLRSFGARENLVRRIDSEYNMLSD